MTGLKKKETDLIDIVTNISGIDGLINTYNNGLEALPRELLSFPVVGIGASAGGLAAFEAFFNGLPADKDSDMAFVLIQHPAANKFIRSLSAMYFR